MPQRTRGRLVTAILAAGLLSGLVLGSPTALAQPAPPPPAPAPPGPPPPGPPPPMDANAFLQSVGMAPAPPPVDPAAPPPPPGAAPAAVPVSAQPTVIPEGTPAGQNPTPFTGKPPFLPPSFNPLDGSMVGVAKPIYINFQRPIANKPMAEQAIHISSSPPVPGRFYWTSDTQVRWRPQDFWPANATVTIDAAGTKSSFRTGDSLVATIDDNTKQMEIVRNGEVEKTFPVSMGKTGYETKKGTYYVLERFKDIVMDSSTYGVPVTAEEGYKIKVKDAVRIDNSGIFVHGAPWSTGSQGESNVSHGCINLSPANAVWFYDNFGSGDPVVIKNTTGAVYDQPDGASDWQMF